MNAGFSAGRNTIAVTEGDFRNRSNFNSWSPSLHLAKKIDGDDKRQLRASLARTFKAPQEDDLTARPVINVLAPCPASALCGSNTVDTADQSGNAALRPEKALGMNLSYEHGIGDDSQVTLEFFVRRIEDKFGTAITLDSVAWSAAPRYVARPVNLGNARMAGISLETQLALRDIWKAAASVILRGSVGLARSRVVSLPGPDNRLDKQTPWTAKLGGSYAMQNLPLKFDIDANWSPPVWIRTSLTERRSLSRRFDLDANAIWSINPVRRLILSVKSAHPRLAGQVDEYTAPDQQVRVYTTSRAYATVGMRLETTL